MPLGFSLLITAVTAGGLGLFIGWLLGARQATITPPDSRLENELRQQLTQRETELGATREQLTKIMGVIRPDLALHPLAFDGDPLPVIKKLLGKKIPIALK